MGLMLARASLLILCAIGIAAVLHADPLTAFVSALLFAVVAVLCALP